MPEIATQIAIKNSGFAEGEVVSHIFLSWNQLERWLRKVEVLRLAS